MKLVLGVLKGPIELVCKEEKEMVSLLERRGERRGDEARIRFVSKEREIRTGDLILDGGERVSKTEFLIESVDEAGEASRAQKQSGES